MSVLEAALEYLEMGFNVIPISKNAKVPLVKWKIYQTEKTTKEQIKEWFKIYPSSQVCIVTGQISNLFVIDCDSIEVFSFVSDFLPDSLVVPTIKTPSGNWHLWFSYPSGSGLTVATNCVMKNLDYRGEGGIAKAPPSVNGNGKSYQWLVKGDLLSLPEVPIKLLQLIKSNNNNIKNNVFSVCVADPQKPHGNNWVQGGTSGNTGGGLGRILSFEKPGRDDTLFHIGNSLCRSGMPIENVKQVIERLALTCIPPFPENELEIKIKSILQRAEKRERPITEELRDFIDRQQVGTFRLQDAYNHLQVATRDDKKAVQIALRRMDGRLVEKVGSVLGTYKIINQDLKEIDLNDKSDLRGELPIKFPLGIHEFIKPMPGCVYIVAGEPDAGKSAFLMNFAKKNYKENKVHYFTSEMGKEELLDRFQYFWPDVGSFIKFYERGNDFADVIFPDDINIIDYLALFDNFFLMAGLIDAIGKKLKKGIVFIALQKPRGREEALGGDRTKDLARLYLAMSLGGTLKIVKAKNWRDSKMNPNRLEINYKIIDGCKFVNETPWRKP